MKKVIVIGAGILGASTAYELARKGIDVTVIDRQDEGQATSAAAGIVCPWLSQRRNKAWYLLAKEGAAYYTELTEKLKADGETATGFEKVGALSIHHDDKKLDAMAERARKRRESAPEIGEITRLTEEEVRELVPVLAEGYGGVHVSGAGRVDGRALRQSLVQAARKHGAMLMEGDAELITSGRTVTGVKAAGRQLEADLVIAATGGWGKELFRPLEINFAVRRQRAQIIHLHLSNSSTETWPVVMPPGDHYMLAFPDGKIVAGTTYEDETTDFLKAEVTAGGIHQILQKTLALAPSLAESTMTETRVGFRPFTPGFLPVFGKVPNYEGILVGNGLGATGLTMGPYIGSLLAGMALQEETDIDLSAYDPMLALD